jgi:hypothetical protein
LIKTTIRTIILCGVLAILGCGAGVGPNMKSGLIDITATVAYKDFEGGFYAIDGDDGVKYNPLNLADEFRKNGLRIQLTAVLRPEMMSMYNYGNIIEIREIALVED